jgi:hypothetical protein
MLEDPENEEITLADLQRAKRHKTFISTANFASWHQPTTDTPPSPILTAAAADDDNNNVKFGDDNNYAEEETHLDEDKDEDECTTIFRPTNPDKWIQIWRESDAHEIEPRAYTGTEKYFIHKLSDEVISLLKDTNGDIRFGKVLEGLLPIFGAPNESDDLDFFQFIAARMRN